MQTFRSDATAGLRYSARMAAAALNAPRARPEARLTPARVKTICDLVRRGVPQAAAAGSVGIPRRTYQMWLAKGREPGAPEPYASLAEKLEVALDEFHMSRAVIVGESADDRTALEVLRRRFKDDWADPERGGTTVNVQNVVEVRSQTVAEVLTAARSALEPEAFERLVDALAPQVVEGEAVEQAELEA